MKPIFLFVFLICGETIPAQERLYRIETQDHSIGFINSNGKVILKPQFDFLSDRSYHGYRWIHAGGKAHEGYIKGGKWALIRLGTANDRMIVEPKFDWVGHFSEGLAPALIKDQWGFVDTTGRMRITPQFPDSETPDFEVERTKNYHKDDWDSPPENWFIDNNFPEYAKEHGHKFGRSLPPSYYFVFRNGQAWIRLKKGAAIIDTAGAVVKTLNPAPRFDDQFYFDFNSCVIRNGNRFGVINRTGDTIVPMQDKKISGVQFVNNNLNWIAVESSANPAVSKWGLMNTKGQWLTEPEFDKVWVRLNVLTWVRNDKLWGLIDTAGQFLVEPQFEQIEHFYEYGMKVQKNKKWGLVDNSGNRLHESRWDELGYPDDGIAKIVENKKIGFIDRDGKILAAPQFRYSEFPHNGFVWVAGDSGWCVLNREGKIVIPPNKTFQYVYGFNEGVAWIRFNNLYGLVDTTGRLIASPSLDFRNPCSFKDGLGWVQKDGLWSLLRKNGEIVFQIKCSSAADFDGELALIWFDEKNRGYVNKQGKVVWKEIRNR